VVPPPQDDEAQSQRPPRTAEPGPRPPVDLPSGSGPLPAVPEPDSPPTGPPPANKGQPQPAEQTKAGDGAVGRGLEKLGDKTGKAADAASAAGGGAGGGTGTGGGAGASSPPAAGAKADPLGSSSARAGGGRPSGFTKPGSDTGGDKDSGSETGLVDKAKDVSKRLSGGGDSDPMARVGEVADKATDRVLGDEADASSAERGAGGIGKGLGAGIGAFFGGSAGAKIGGVAGKAYGRFYGKVAVKAIPVVALIGLVLVMSLFGTTLTDFSQPVGPPAEFARQEIASSSWSEAYLRVGEETGVPWPILAAIGEIATESGCRSPYDNITRGTDCSTSGDVGGGGTGTVNAEGKSFPVAEPYQFSDTWGAARSGGRSHEGTDIMAADGTELYAIADGTITRDTNGLGGTVIHLIDAEGTDYYYAHMSGYADSAPDGSAVEAGDLIGYVGSSGDASADAPHLHFGIYEGGRGGTAVNPFSLLNEITGGNNNTTGDSGTVPAAPDASLGGGTEGQNWPEVSPAIGGGGDEGTGPFLVPPDVRDDNPNINFQDAEQSLEFVAGLLDEIRDDRHGGADPDTGEPYDPYGVAEAGFWDPSSSRSVAVDGVDGTEEHIQEFWNGVLQEFPITLDTIGCQTAAFDDSVPALIESAFRCEALNHASVRIETADGPVEGPQAVAQLVAEAQGVAWAWSRSGQDECDSTAEAAGVFPLAEDSGADRCNPISNIATAAQIVFESNESPASGPVGARAGWSRMPGALGPENGAGFEFFEPYDPPGDENGDEITECQQAVVDATNALPTSGGGPRAIPWAAFSADDQSRYDQKWADSAFNSATVTDVCGDPTDGYPWRRWVRETIESLDVIRGTGAGSVGLEKTGLVNYLRAVAPAQLPAEPGITSLVPRVSNPPVTVQGAPVAAGPSPSAGGGQDPEAFADDVIQRALELVGAVEPGSAAGDEVAALVAAGVPQVVAEAYVAARDKLAVDRPDCQIPVELIAGHGYIESGHGTSGGASADAQGNITPQIFGPPTRYGRAVGPMQFLQSTWDGYVEQYGPLDGNNDGQQDPHNIFDAALAGGIYDCVGGGGSLAEAGSDNQRRAIFSYNHSDVYVNDVLAAAARIRAAMDAYLASAAGGGPVTAGAPTGNIEAVDCIAGGVDASIAANVRSMQAAATGGGVRLCGSGWRSTDRQIQLRTINGCPDVWTAPASSCRVPTAIPGRSQHERGLAIDFDNCSSRGTACFVWLSSNAARYGLYNLPSEPWHWSVNGS